MVTSDFRLELEIWPFHACTMHPAIIIGTVRLLWNGLCGRYHVPRDLFLVEILARVLACVELWMSFEIRAVGWVHVRSDGEWVENASRWCSCCCVWKVDAKIKKPAAGHKEKSVLQAKLTKLTIKIGYVGQSDSRYFLQSFCTDCRLKYIHSGVVNITTVRCDCTSDHCLKYQ